MKTVLTSNIVGLRELLHHVLRKNLTDEAFLIKAANSKLKANIYLPTV